MKFFENIQPAWALRVGLGLMYVYSGASLIRQPYHWQGFLPPWFADLVSRPMPLETYLKVQGAGELAMAAVFLLPFVPLFFVRIAAAIAAFEFAGILLFTGLDLATFRDIGLLGAAMALLLLTWRRHQLNSS